MEHMRNAIDMRSYCALFFSSNKEIDKFVQTFCETLLNQ